MVSSSVSTSNLLGANHFSTKATAWSYVRSLSDLSVPRCLADQPLQSMAGLDTRQHNQPMLGERVAQHATHGGIAKALPLLASGQADDPFWLVSADIFAPAFAFDPAAAHHRDRE